MKMRNLVSTIVVVALMLTGFVGANQIRQLQADLDAANETIFNSQMMISEGAVALGGATAAQPLSPSEQAINLDAPVSLDGSAANKLPVSSISQVTQKWDTAYLAKFNGKNGNPTYIAVFGTVYDVSGNPNWTNGKHKGITAGADVTNAFEGSPHAKALLKSLPVVAKMGDAVKGLSAMAEPATRVLESSTAPTAKVVAVAPSSLVKSQQTAMTPARSSAAQQWTLAYLANFNGKNGNPAYIAVSGVIYDVSANRSWVNGSHKGVQAGADVTNAFANSPHAKSLLAQLPIVAKFGDAIIGVSNTATVTTTQNNIALNTSSSSLGVGNTDDEDDDDDDDDDEDDDDEDDDDDDDDGDDD